MYNVQSGKPSKSYSTPSPLTVDEQKSTVPGDGKNPSLA